MLRDSQEKPENRVEQTQQLRAEISKNVRCKLKIKKVYQIPFKGPRTDLYDKKQ